MDIAAMNHETVRTGISVRTADSLDPWEGRLDPGTRRAGTVGRVVWAAPHQAAGAWRVQHEDGSTATYLSIELTPVSMNLGKL